MDIRIEDLRNQLGVTALDFARELGLSKASYYLRENGNQSWKIHELIRISELMKQVTDDDRIELKSGLNNYSINIKKI